MSTRKISGGTVHRIPSDMKEALASDAKAHNNWEDLTPLARNEWICWTTYVKRAETRREHVERMISELKEGKRRPCCWYGCIHRTDKAISPSIQNIVLNKQRKRS